MTTLQQQHGMVWADDNGAARDQEEEDDEYIKNHEHHLSTLLKGCQKLIKAAADLQGELEKNVDLVGVNMASKLREMLEDVDKAMDTAVLGLGEEKGKQAKRALLENRQELVEGAEEAVLELVEQMLLSEAQVNAMRAVKENIQGWDFRQNPKAAVVPDIENLVCMALKNIPANFSEQDLRSHAKFQAFKDNMGGLLAGGPGEDDDITMVGGAGVEIPTTCGITQTLLVNPVQSKVCKHIFSLEGIAQIYKKIPSNASKRCPFAGCTSSNRRSDFESSQQLTNKVEMAIKRRERLQKLEHQKQAATQADVEEL